MKFWESQMLYIDFRLARVSTPNSSVVQGSTVIVRREYSEKNTVMRVNDPGYGFIIQYLDLGS